MTKNLSWARCQLYTPRTSHTDEQQKAAKMNRKKGNLIYELKIDGKENIGLNAKPKWDFRGCCCFAY